MSVSGWGMALAGLDDVLDLFDQMQVRFDGGTVYVVGPTVEYAVVHEIGNSEHEARPYMRPAAEAVQASPEHHAQRVAASQGIDLTTEDGLVRALALAVQDLGKRIADAKDIRDTGQLIASITIQRIE